MPPPFTYLKFGAVFCVYVAYVLFRRLPIAFLSQIRSEIELDNDDIGRFIEKNAKHGEVLESLSSAIVCISLFFFSFLYLSIFFSSLTVTLAVLIVLWNSLSRFLVCCECELNYGRLSSGGDKRAAHFCGVQ